MDLVDVQNTAALDRALAAAKLAKRLVGRSEAEMIPAIMIEFADIDRRALERAAAAIEQHRSRLYGISANATITLAVQTIRALIPTD